jgi:hypothetical protein
MEFKGTKGKWEVTNHNDVYSKYALPIALIYDGSTTLNSFKESDIETCKSNAKLIASAPEMFEQLKSMREAILSDDYVRMLAESQKTKELLTKITE